MAVPCRGDGHFHFPLNLKPPGKATPAGICSSREPAPPSIRPDTSDYLRRERGQDDTHTEASTNCGSLLGAAFTVPSTAHAQPGYGAKITCSSNDGKRNWCAIGTTRDVQLVRQISGSPCVRGDTWGIDNRGLWVDRGCRAEFVIGRPPGPPPSPPVQTINCSSNNGKRNWCAIGTNRDVQLVRQISGSPCVRGDTWGIDNRGLWVDRGCRADFAIGRSLGPPPPPPPVIINCSSNNGKRNWCDIGNRRDVQLTRQISGSPCVRGDTWAIDQRGLWVDRGCRADFTIR